MSTGIASCWLPWVLLPAASVTVSVKVPTAWSVPFSATKFCTSKVPVTAPVASARVPVIGAAVGSTATVCAVAAPATNRQKQRCGQADQYGYDLCIGPQYLDV